MEVLNKVREYYQSHPEELRNFLIGFVVMAGICMISNFAQTPEGLTGFQDLANKLVNGSIPIFDNFQQAKTAIIAVEAIVSLGAGVAASYVDPSDRSPF